MPPIAFSRWHVASRVLAGTLGSYVFAWGFIALLSTLLLALGVDFHEATNLAAMLGLLVFPGALLGAFVASGLGRVWLILAGGGALMTAVGWSLSRTLA